MVKRVIWSQIAQNDRKEILNYWFHRNKSKTYSKKLNELFIKSIKLISDFPEIGKPTDIPNVRIKLVRDHLLVYEAQIDKILILTIFDARQNPQKLDDLFKGTSNI